MAPQDIKNVIGIRIDEKVGNHWRMLTDHDDLEHCRQNMKLYWL